MLIQINGYSFEVDKSFLTVCQKKELAAQIDNIDTARKILEIPKTTAWRWKQPIPVPFTTILEPTNSSKSSYPYDVRKENPEKSFRPIYKENSTEFAADFPRYGWTELFGKIFPNNEKEQAFKEELATFGITVEDYLTKFMIKEEYEESEEEEHYWWRPSAYKLHTARVGFAYGEKFHFIAVRQNGTHIYDPNRRTATKWNIFIRFKSSQCVKMITSVYRE